MKIKNAALLVILYALTVTVVKSQTLASAIETVFRPLLMASLAIFKYSIEPAKFLLGSPMTREVQLSGGETIAIMGLPGLILLGAIGGWIGNRLKSQPAGRLFITGKIFFSGPETALLFHSSLKKASAPDLLSLIAMGFSTMTSGTLLYYSSLLEPSGPRLAFFVSSSLFILVLTCFVARMIAERFKLETLWAPLSFPVGEEEGIIPGALRGLQTAFGVIVMGIVVVASVRFLGVTSAGTCQDSSWVNLCLWMKSLLIHESAAFENLKQIIETYSPSALHRTVLLIASFTNVYTFGIQIGAFYVLAPGFRRNLLKFVSLGFVIAFVTRLAATLLLSIAV